MPAPHTTSPADDNAALLRRVEIAEATIARLVAESRERERVVRALVAELPSAVSKKAVLRAMARDAVATVRARFRRSAA
ncbi:MAG: hypothetical protein Q7V57_19595 [Actinomycetota bacterium]|nr:hypothetical protein [Actinomycetota bacterium]